MKQYDQSYFDRWYRSRAAVVTPVSRARKVRLAVAAAEFVLGREIRSVLDVGCGEAPWRAVLRRLRPKVDYLGVDASEYVVRRFGQRRNIRHGSLGTLGRMRLKRRYDLIVCADVIAYVPSPELYRGLRALRRLLGGVAYLEAYTGHDDVVGDLEGWHIRSAAAYRKIFAAAGLSACGLNCWVPRERQHWLSALERCG
ncbi:MAG: methyltransferase domain-containing protein [Longimicrobiales bacterium]